MKASNSFPIRLMLLFTMAFNGLQAQNYRTAEAYIADFGKNERYITESLIQYSSAVINGEKDTRARASLEAIYKKLENINAIVTKNDVGFAGDTSLRDMFLKVNKATFTRLNDNTLRLDDYEAQRHLSYDEILNDFELRKSDIINYYGLIVDYTNAKRRFSRQNHLKHVRYFSNRNIFEYDAHQSLIFYKMNVLDAKLADLLQKTDDANVSQCVSYLNQVCQESLTQIEEYKKEHIDQSVNNANSELIAFLTQRNEVLIPMYKDYIQALTNLKNTETASNDNQSPDMGQRNELEKQLTVTKNKFTEAFHSNQDKKKALVAKWYDTKRTFLKNNL